jgi:phosphohistidine phosphatase
MKEVIFMRHGKSSWEYRVADQDRPLNQRGIDDAHLVGGVFAKTDQDVDRIYSSPANRALHTCMIVAKELGYQLQQVSIDAMLYDFSGDNVLSFLKGLDNELGSIMLFGHNHALTYVANALGTKNIENVPTSGLVHIRFDIGHWKELHQGKTVNTIFPKHLKP